MAGLTQATQNALRAAIANNQAYTEVKTALELSDPNSVTAGTAAASKAVVLSSTKSVSGLGGVTSSSPTLGIGYGTGAGGTVTQATDRSTGVTLNTICGQITMNAASLAAAAEATFTVTNSAVAATDVVVACIQSGNTTGTPAVVVSAVAAGSFQLTVTNLHASTADTTADVINFVVIKGVAA